MPTGYTDSIYRGTPTTLTEFILRCSRAMGAAIHQRDETTDNAIRELEIDGYYAADVERYRVRLDEMKARTYAEWEAAQASEISECTRARDAYITERAAIRERYEAMLADVNAWKPPTAEHNELKKFMQSQLRESIRFDCGDWTPQVPESLPVGLYAANTIEAATNDLAKAEERLKEHLHRVASQNQWVRDLYESLPSS